jgi:apolipoprotein N-acyltransferase
MQRHRKPLMTRRSAALVALATALYTASLPPFGADLLAFSVGWPLALLVLDVRRPLSVREACFAGFVFGEATTLAVGGHWLYLAAREFFGRPAPFSLAFTLLTTITHAGIFLGAAVAISGALVRLRSVLLRVMAFAAVWVSFEFFRARVLYGCPWDFLGHALYRRPLLMQAGSFGGAYVLSWLCLVTGAGVAAATRATTLRGKAIGLMASAAIPAVMIVHGSLRIHASDGAGPQSALTVGLVQANVGRHELWDPRRRTDHLDRLISLSRSPELAGTDLLVWAENAVPFLLDADVDARGRIHELARELDAVILTGAPRSEPSGDGRAHFFNSVYLFWPDGEGLATYDKVKLLPYVERTPSWAADWLPRKEGVEYSPGAEQSIFEVSGWKIAPLVCFESTYPETSRVLASRGAELFVNVSNDSWFDRGAAPAQHFGMTVLRTVENHVPLVRVANTGVSAVVDAEGRIVLELPRRKPAVARYRIERPTTPGTFYSRHGDVFAWGCVVAAIASLLFCLRGRGGAG